MYHNSPGGMVSYAVYKKSDNHNLYVYGSAFWSCSACRGKTKDKRYALMYSCIVIHQTLIYGGGLSCTVSCIDVETKELVSTKQKLSEIIAEHTGKTSEQVLRDTDINYYMFSTAGSKGIWSY